MATPPPRRPAGRALADLCHAGGPACSFGLLVREGMSSAWCVAKGTGGGAGARPATGLAGPYATMVLADLGADVINDVINVERPGGGDDTSRWGPRFRGDDAAYFLSVNRGRRSVALDLTCGDHRGVLARHPEGAGAWRRDADG